MSLSEDRHMVAADSLCVRVHSTHLENMPDVPRFSFLHFGECVVTGRLSKCGRRGRRREALSNHIVRESGFLPITSRGYRSDTLFTDFCACSVLSA